MHSYFLQQKTCGAGEASSEEEPVDSSDEETVDYGEEETVDSSVEETVDSSEEEPVDSKNKECFTDDDCYIKQETILRLLGKNAC